MSSPHVLIIGAGLAGPSMALALARHQIRSSVFERREKLSDITGVGGVLMLSPNAVNVLDKVMGAEPHIRPLGFTYKAIEMHATSGTEPMYKLGDFGRTMDGDVHGLTIKRPVLHAKLLELCEQQKEYITVQFGKRLVDVNEREDGVTAVFDDGTTAEGDILLGLDGIHSRVRQHVLGGPEAAQQYAAGYTGDVVLGGIIERSKLPNITDGTTLGPPIFIYTQAGTILSFPTDAAGEHIQWATFVRTPERPRREWEQYKTSGDALRDLREAWKGVTAEPINTLMNSLSPHEMNLWAPYAIPAELPSWHTDRTCLLGDSVHAISPSAGQGTAQALEDVGYLSMLLGSAAAREKGYKAIFAQYEAVRRVRLDGIRKMTERSLGTKRATPNSSWWWVKKTGMKAMFSAMGAARSIGLGVGNPMEYDVTKEKIEI